MDSRRRRNVKKTRAAASAACVSDCSCGQTAPFRNPLSPNATAPGPNPAIIPPCRPPKKRLLTVVAPACNEEEVIAQFCARVCAEVAKRPEWRLELLIVDDGSSDNTAEVVRKLHAEDPRVGLLSFFAQLRPRSGDAGRAGPRPRRRRGGDGLRPAASARTAARNAGQAGRRL